MTLQEKGGGCGKTGKASLQHRERLKFGAEYEYKDADPRQSRLRYPDQSARQKSSLQMTNPLRISHRLINKKH
ncbi:hypothetical protein [Candidatus Desulforudis audaxviator]|uniref:hypothetical protein n=1 Tax=Candidatus Desulforudis audaxviator TaxID=471827 RepID=UPI00140FBBF8|nr:hypothetical protein [Candidatus Desulforudis audaxviator]